MKSLLTTLLLVFSLSVFSQTNYIKINVLGLFFEDYGIGYEHKINEVVGFGFFAKTTKYSYPIAFAELLHSKNKNYTYNSKSIALEAKFHAAPLDNGAEVFMGIYGRYKVEDVSDLISTYNTDTVSYGYSYNGIALGFLMGLRKTFYSGVFFELSGGVGRFFGSEPVFTDEDIGKRIYESHHIMDYADYNYFSYWDTRLQLSVGFGF